MSPAPAQWFTSAAARARSQLSYRAIALKAWSIVSATVENFIQNNDLLRAAALTYTVALSIVPILALAFSALHGLGMDQRLRPLIERYLALGSANTANQLMSYVSNVNAAALGTAGIEDKEGLAKAVDVGVKGRLARDAGEPVPATWLAALAAQAFDMPEVRFARSGDVDIAYQVFGEGPIDLVFAGGILTHLEVYWE